MQGRPRNKATCVYVCGQVSWVQQWLTTRHWQRCHHLVCDLHTKQTSWRNSRDCWHSLSVCKSLCINRGYAEPSNVGTRVAPGLIDPHKAFPNCNTWVMNVVLNSMHLWLPVALVNPFLRNTRHTVLPDTITPVASYIAWHIYRDGFSCIIAIMNSLWWPSSFRASSLESCFSGATFPVSLNLEKKCSVQYFEQFVITFLSVQKLNPSQPSLCHTTLHPVSGEFSTQSTHCSGYYQLAKFEYPAL